MENQQAFDFSKIIGPSYTVLLDITSAVGLSEIITVIAPKKSAIKGFAFDGRIYKYANGCSVKVGYALFQRGTKPFPVLAYNIPGKATRATYQEFLEFNGLA